jgi:translation initiation factor 2 subunit 1
VIEWKREERALAIISAVKNRLGLSDEQTKSLVAKLEEEFGTLYASLEAAAKKKEKAFQPLGLPAETGKVLAEVAGEKIIPPRYEVGALVEMSSKSPDGIDHIKKTLMAAAEATSAEVHITYAGAPRYRVRITADDYKQAEKALDGVIEKVKDGVGKHDGFSFKREISRKYGGAA